MYWKAAVLHLESTSGVVWQAELSGTMHWLCVPPALGQSCPLDQAAPHLQRRRERGSQSFWIELPQEGRLTHPLAPTRPPTLPLTQGRAVDETLPLLQPSLRQQKRFPLLHLPMTHRLQLHAEGEREREREGERERGRGPQTSCRGRGSRGSDDHDAINY